MEKGKHENDTAPQTGLPDRPPRHTTSERFHTNRRRTPTASHIRPSAARPNAAPRDQRGGGTVPVHFNQPPCRGQVPHPFSHAARGERRRRAGGAGHHEHRHACPGAFGAGGRCVQQKALAACCAARSGACAGVLFAIEGQRLSAAAVLAVLPIIGRATAAAGCVGFRGGERLRAPTPNDPGLNTIACRLARSAPFDSRGARPPCSPPRPRVGRHRVCFHRGREWHSAALGRRGGLSHIRGPGAQPRGHVAPLPCVDARSFPSAEARPGHSLHRRL